MYGRSKYILDEEEALLYLDAIVTAWPRKRTSRTSYDTFEDDTIAYIDKKKGQQNAR